MPTQPEATLKRPESSADIAILKPSPTSPISALSGTSTSSRNSSAVSEPLRPSLPWMACDEKPSLSVGTRKQAIPRCCFSGSVCAKTSATLAKLPIEIHCLAPLMTQPPSVFFARVCWFAASEPVPGSVRPKQPSASPEQSCGSHCCFCSSSAQRTIDEQTSEV